MSFAALKKNRTDLSKLVQQAQETSGTTQTTRQSDDPRFWIRLVMVMLLFVSYLEMLRQLHHGYDIGIMLSKDQPVNGILRSH